MKGCCCSNKFILHAKQNMLFIFTEEGDNVTSKKECLTQKLHLQDSDLFFKRKQLLQVSESQVLEATGHKKPSMYN